MTKKEHGTDPEQVADDSQYHIARVPRPPSRVISLAAATKPSNGSAGIWMIFAMA
jgi:hypothetical protein